MVAEEVNPKELCECVRVNIRERRRELGLRQSEVSKAAEISQAYLCQIETGVRVPDVEILAKLSAPLRTTAAALMTPGIFSAVPVDSI